MPSGIIDISTYLEQILSERYARNVRQAIYDAISGANTNSVNAKELADDVDARMDELEQGLVLQPLIGIFDTTVYDNNTGVDILFKALVTDSDNVTRLNFWFTIAQSDPAPSSATQLRFNDSGIYIRELSDDSWTCIAGDGVITELDKKIEIRNVDGTGSAFNNNTTPNIVYRATINGVTYLFWVDNTHRTQYRLSRLGFQYRTYIIAEGRWPDAWLYFNNPVIESSSSFDTATDPTRIYSVNDGENEYILINNNDSTVNYQLRFNGSTGLEFRIGPAPWSQWYPLANDAVYNDVISGRGSFASLNARFLAIEGNTTSAVAFEELTDSSTVFDDNTTVGTMYKVRHENFNYIFFITGLNSTQYRISSAGIEYRRYDSENAQWPSTWTNIINNISRNALAGDVQATLANADDLFSRDLIETVNLGTVASASDLNTQSYCSESARFIFIPGTNFKTFFGFYGSADIVCELTMNNMVQTLTFINLNQFATVSKIRKIINIYPFQAENWSSNYVPGGYIMDRTVQFNKLGVEVQSRIRSLESTILTKADIASVMAFLDSNNKIIHICSDSGFPPSMIGNNNVKSMYISSNITSVNKSTLLNNLSNLSTIYCDNLETDMQITGSGNITFYFKNDFNTGELLLTGIADTLNNFESRISALENT